MVITEIKIGRKTFKIEQEDYIYYNGACYQFCTNGRVLYRKGFDSYTTVVIPKSVLKTIPLDKLEKIEVKNTFTENIDLKYIFK